MPCFIKESFLVKICLAVYKKTVAFYNESKLKKIVLFIVSCAKESKSSQLLNKYVKRNPYFLNSVFFKAIKKLANAVDKIFAFFYKLFLPSVNESKIIKEIKIINSLKIYNKLRLLAVFIAAVDFGFCLGSFVKGTLSQVSFGYILIPVVICFCLLGAKKIVEAFKNSLVYKGIKFLLD